jgi:hypothetical protein
MPRQTAAPVVVGVAEALALAAGVGVLAERASMEFRHPDTRETNATRVHVAITSGRRMR